MRGFGKAATSIGFIAINGAMLGAATSASKYTPAANILPAKHMKINDRFRFVFCLIVNNSKCPFVYEYTITALRARMLNVERTRELQAGVAFGDAQ